MAKGSAFAFAVLALAAVAAAGGVGVVVQYDDARFEARCVAAAGGETAADVLARSGFSLDIADFGWGKAVCGVDGVGCPAANCWCAGSSFWSLKQKNGGAWQDASVGISDLRVNDGDAIGLRWGAFGAAMADAPDPCATAPAQNRADARDVEAMNASFTREGCRLTGLETQTSSGNVVPYALVRVLSSEGGVNQKILERESDGEGFVPLRGLADGIYRVQVLYPNAVPFDGDVNAADCGTNESLTFAVAQRIKEPERKDIKPFMLVDMVRHALTSVDGGWAVTGWLHTGWGESKRWPS